MVIIYVCLSLGLPCLTCYTFVFINKPCPFTIHLLTIMWQTISIVLEWHGTCLGFGRFLYQPCTQFIKRSLVTHPFPFIPFHITLSSSLCVHLTITPCQANDRSCNRMSAFLDSVALLSVPTRQITKKVKLASAITNCKSGIHHNQLTYFNFLTFINFQYH